MGVNQFEFQIPILMLSLLLLWLLSYITSSERKSINNNVNSYNYDVVNFICSYQSFLSPPRCIRDAHNGNFAQSTGRIVRGKNSLTNSPIQ